MIIITDGITNASINDSKYLFIFIHDGDEGDDDLARFWILCPKVNANVPINKESTEEHFE
jgi:hypothetical protein